MEFKDELSRFHRETHMIFRNTVLELNDSIVQKNIVAIAGGELRTHIRRDTGSSRGGERMMRVWVDSLKKIGNLNIEGRSITNDSASKRGVVFRFRLDSFDRDAIHNIRLN